MAVLLIACVGWRLTDVSVCLCVCVLPVGHGVYEPNGDDSSAGDFQVIVLQPTGTGHVYADGADLVASGAVDLEYEVEVEVKAGADADSLSSSHQADASGLDTPNPKAENKKPHRGKQGSLYLGFAGEGDGTAATDA